MNPPAVRVVRKDHVTGSEVVGAVAGHSYRDVPDERSEMHRLGEGLGDRPQVLIEKGAGKILTGLHIRRIGRPPEGNGHLLRRLCEGVADDFELYRVNAGAFRPVSCNRCCH